MTKPIGAQRLAIIPCELEDANLFVKRFHRHHPPVKGHRFSLAVVGEDNQIHGVAIVGRPGARALQDGFTVEVTRVATDGTPNMCSCLYAAARRAAFALGYRRVVTYNLTSESGISLLAAGYVVVAEVKGRSWDCPSRPRVQRNPAQLEMKFRWEVTA